MLERELQHCYVEAPIPIQKAFLPSVMHEYCENIVMGRLVYFSVVDN
jgi:hypothetical protein